VLLAAVVVLPLGAAWLLATAARFGGRPLSGA
jgi:hypothetical protein